MGMQSKEKFHYIPNGIVKKDWMNPEPLPELHAQTLDKLSGKFIVGYLGGHALSNALDTIIEAASQINNENIAFVLVGQGTEKTRLIEKSKSLNCHNVFFLPNVPKKVVPTILNKFDALYIGGKTSPLAEYGASLNKVYDYMMSGKPIIYGINFRNNEVEEAGCGITIEPENIEDLNRAISFTINMSDEERISIGKNGKRWVLANCEYSNLAQKFLNVINKK
jgi:glycosyltransferase involved in cell wall biosynthesis